MDEQASGMMEPVIYEGLNSPKLPYTSRWIEVSGSKMHYIEGGRPNGDPILFVHGVPTWLYDWREIMPELAAHGRVIAVDLIGYGRSDKPHIDYTWSNHAEYFARFVEALGLRNVTFVAHDVGAIASFVYASRHEENVKGVVFMEGAYPPGFPPSPEMLGMFEPFTTAEGVASILNGNAMIEMFVLAPEAFRRERTADEKNAYRFPYATPDDRIALADALRQFFDPAQIKIMEAYIAWMQETELPMLYTYYDARQCESQRLDGGMNGLKPI